jgi:acetyltransferase-like isoleucine patch superfamily enzyme
LQDPFFGGAINNTIIIEKGCNLKRVSITIFGSNNTIHIKQGTTFFDGGRIRCKYDGNQLTIGNDCTINYTFFALDDYNTKINIGANSLTSAQVVIRTSDGHSILDMEGNRINPPKDVVIGEHVWIGYGANILKGTVLGNDSIVGAQSLVTGITAPANSIVAGTPAKVLKTGCNWDIKLIKMEK